MKNKILIAVAVLALAGSAFAQQGYVGSPNFNPVENLKNIKGGRPQYVAGSSATNILGPILQMRRDRPIVIETVLNGTNAAASGAVSFVFRYSNDGTNWSTAGNSYSVTATGATALTSLGTITNGTGATAIFPRYAQLWYITNAASSTSGHVWVTNVVTGVWDP